MKDFNFTLQIKGEENKVIGNIVQNDTANRFIIRLRDGISPVVLDETDIVTVTYKRSNDTVVVDAMGGGSITVADFNAGEIVIVPDAAAVTNVGMVNATVEVYDGTGHKLSSARFSFTVTPDLAGHADASTDSSFPALQNLITLLATKNDGWEDAEKQRVANENVRVANEDGRVTAEQERARVWAQLEEMCRELIKEMVSPDVEVKSNTLEEYILTITDKDGSFDTPNLKPGMGSGTGDMLMADYDPDKDGSVRMADNAAKLAGHGVDYFSFWRNCSNVPFSEIAKGKGVFMVGWDSANSPNANVLFGVSDGWTAIAVSYTGDIYITTIEKTAWEHVNAPASFMPKVQYVTQAGTDLNDYKQDGFYYFDADYTPANIPAGVNGWLEVYSSNVGVVKQKWFRHGTANSNDHNTYIRTFIAGSWSGWAFVMTAKGGTFAGDVKAYETARTTRGLFNNETRAGSTTGTLQSVKYFIDVT